MCLMPPSSVHASPMQVAQFWELVRDASLLSRTTPLAAIDELLLKARAPPPELLAHRQQVRSNPRRGA